MYHVVAMLLYLAAGLCLMVHLNSEKNRRYITNYEAKTAAAVSLTSSLSHTFHCFLFQICGVLSFNETCFFLFFFA